MMFEIIKIFIKNGLKKKKLPRIGIVQHEKIQIIAKPKIKIHKKWIHTPQVCNCRLHELTETNRQVSRTKRLWMQTRAFRELFGLRKILFQIRKLIYSLDKNKYIWSRSNENDTIESKFSLNAYVEFGKWNAFKIQFPFY